MSAHQRFEYCTRQQFRARRTGLNEICFSATSSITAGIVLLTIGAFTVQRTRDWAEAPYAAIPFVFGVHQLIEGLLWQSMFAQTPSSQTLTVIYLLFSHVLWPIYVPAAVWLLEPRAERRRMIAWAVASGGAVSAFFLAAIIAHPATATISGTHIKYHIRFNHDTIAVAGYAAATCLAPLLSSHKAVRLFGIALIGSMMIAAILYFWWFASVWCFFAALLSCLVLLHFWSPGRTRGRTPASSPPQLD